MVNKSVLFRSEAVWCLDIVPILSREWVDGSFLQAFLALGEPLVLDRC